MSPRNQNVSPAFLFIIISSMIASLTCCKSDKKPIAEVKGFKQTIAEKPIVEIKDLNNEVFYQERISNGKLYAKRKAELRFPINELLDRIYVKNGDRVQQGTLLASLEHFTYKNQLERSKISFEKAKVDLQDVLIGQGFNSDDWSDVPPATLKMSKIKSGYENALYDLESAQHSYESTFLKAPFSGIICSLKAKERNLPGSEPFCILVDNSSFEAEFSILESELALVGKGQKVVVSPFSRAEENYTGVISEVNPLIDENGLATVKALVRNEQNKLCEGMNVRVLIKKAVSNCLVVPKQAVVMRLGKEVMFTYLDGLAKWHYVKTMDENSTSYVVTGEDLKAGDKVIVSGNLNLGSDAEVIVK